MCSVQQSKNQDLSKSKNQQGFNRNYSIKWYFVLEIENEWNIKQDFVSRRQIYAQNAFGFMYSTCGLFTKNKEIT